MTEILAVGRKSLTERLAEEIEKLPESKRELVAAILLGTCNGVQIATQMQQKAAS